MQCLEIGLRESHVTEEKQPDLRFRANVRDASVATEIKVIESCSLRELEVALVDQLCDQYLRAQDSRHVVQQKPRPRGCKLSNEKFLKFEDVVHHLREIAANIRHESHAGPQPEIEFIDVTTCFSSKESSDLVQMRSTKFE